MAYLFEYKKTCDTMSCKSRAVVKLIDWQNSVRGEYCRKHGEAARKKRQEFEDTHNRDGTLITPEAASNATR